jgi:hypothetical protein
LRPSRQRSAETRRDRHHRDPHSAPVQPRCGLRFTPVSIAAMGEGSSPRQPVVHPSLLYGIDDPCFTAITGLRQSTTGDGMIAPGCDFGTKITPQAYPAKAAANVGRPRLREKWCGRYRLLRKLLRMVTGLMYHLAGTLCVLALLR